MTDLSAPLDRYRDCVRPEWIDHNGHMNMGYYLVVFDFATDEFFRAIGLDEAHRRASRVTTFCLEAHVTYHREVREGDPLRFTTLLLGHDAKRLHYIHQMYHATGRAHGARDPRAAASDAGGTRQAGAAAAARAEDGTRRATDDTVALEFP